MPAAQARDAGVLLGEWALENDKAEVLQSAIELALGSGASLDAEDPWSISMLANHLAEMPGGAEALLAMQFTRSRGVIAGFSRSDIFLAPGEMESVPLRMAGGEPAIVEARLKRGSEDANLDLFVIDSNGVIRKDATEATGTMSTGTYIEFWPATCTDIEVQVKNVGTGTANAVIFAPASSLLSC